MCFYIKSNLISSPKVTIANDNSIEQLWVTGTLNKIKIGLGVVYKPPNISYHKLDELDAKLGEVFLDVHEVVLMGDINIDLSRNNTADAKFINHIFNIYSLKRTNSDPTRITSTNAKLIDVMCVSKGLEVINVQTKDMMHMSDHCLISTSILLPSFKAGLKTITYRGYKNIEFDKFYIDLENIPFQNIKSIADINQQVDELTTYVLNLFDIHAPAQTATLKENYSPWITATIREMIRLKDKAFKKYLKCRNVASFEYYKSLKNYITSAIRREKSAYIKHKLDLHAKNQKKFWNCIRSWGIGTKSSSSMPTDILNVDALNKHFVCQGYNADKTDEVMTPNLHGSFTDGEACIGIDTITESDVLEALVSIKSNAAGIDLIDRTMLNLVLYKIMDLILHIFNKSISTGTFPNQWKTAIIIPIPKKQNPQLLSDYRPISILPLFSKIFEKIIVSKIISPVTENILPKFQSGFRKQHSTTSALMEIVDNMCQNLDNANGTILIMLDYSKAFDSINHKLLIAKLASYGFNNLAIEWFVSYLHNRIQITKVGCRLSQPLEQVCGVPQGSVLGPTLFSIFTADLPQSILHSQYHMYADDIQLYHYINSDNIQTVLSEIQYDIDNIELWSRENILQLNPEKTKMLYVNSNRNIKHFCKTNMVVTYRRNQHSACE